MVDESPEVDKYVRKVIQPDGVITKKSSTGSKDCFHIAGMFGSYCMHYSGSTQRMSNHKHKPIEVYPPRYAGWCENCLAVHFYDGEAVHPRETDWESRFEEEVRRMEREDPTVPV